MFSDRLRAPLKNVRWSWGAVSKTGDAYLRVWADEIETIDGKRCARLTNHSAFKNKPKHPGYRERNEHVSMIKCGTKAYAVLCRAENAGAAPRKIASFDRKQLLVGGTVIQDSHGDDWLEIVGTRKV